MNKIKVHEEEFEINSRKIKAILTREKSRDWKGVPYRYFFVTFCISNGESIFEQEIDFGLGIVHSGDSRGGERRERFDVFLCGMKFALTECLRWKIDD
jgi:hypothetical protein